MALHIVLMNLAAPLLVAAVLRHLPRARPAQLAGFTLLQLGLIWFWHSPPVLPGHGDGHWIMQASLMASALLFWWSVLSLRQADQWRSIVALLVTSKLFCLLGVLLSFSPRHLYGMSGGGADALADQQLAGLLMIIACPATYLLAGVILAARWLGALEGDDRPDAGRAADA